MTRRTRNQNWAFCESLAELAAGCRPRTARLIVLHCASAPGANEAPPALVEVDAHGVVTHIKRLREERRGRLGR